MQQAAGYSDPVTGRNRLVTDLLQAIDNPQTTENKAITGEMEPVASCFWNKRI